MRYLRPILALIFLAAAIGACVYLFLDIERAAFAITTARSEIASIGARDTFAKAAAQFLLETGDERAAVRSLVIEQEQTAAAIVLVEQAATLAGVKATVSSASLAPSSYKKLEELAIVVSAEGPLKAHANFATVLESLPKGAYLAGASLEARNVGWFGSYTIMFVTRTSP